MTLAITGNKGPATRVCRICKRPFFHGEQRAFERHTRKCAESYMEAKRPERARLDFLKPWDPELHEYVTSGRYKPLTQPKSD